jgi:hypothetical protein
MTSSDRLVLAYSVEKLCFKIDDDFICDLSSVAYCMHEEVAGGA